MTKIKKYCQFYAIDRISGHSELLSYRIPNKNQALKCVWRFKNKGLIILADYYVERDEFKQVLNNIRIVLT